MSDSTSLLNSRRRRAALLARIASVLLLLIMFLGTHVPSHSAPGLTVSDKLIHASAFMTLTISLLLSWESSTGVLRPQHYFAVWLFGALYGAFDEVTQTSVGRSCDGLDWVADNVGIVIGLILYRLVRPLFSHWF